MSASRNGKMYQMYSCVLVHIPKVFWIKYYMLLTLNEPFHLWVYVCDAVNGGFNVAQNKNVRLW